MPLARHAYLIVTNQLVKMSNNCQDVNKPSVDETQLECCNIYRTNCVVTSEADQKLGWAKGETLTKVLGVISQAIKTIKDKLKKVSNKETYSALLTQTATNAPVISSEDNLVQAVTATAAYTNPGEYTLTFSQGILNPNGSHVLVGSVNFPNSVHAYVATPTTIVVETRVSGALADGVLSNTTIYVKR